jgi:hypothetical protein
MWRFGAGRRVTTLEVKVKEERMRFWRGFQKRLARAAGAESLEQYGASHVATFTGEQLFYALLFAVCFWSLKSRRFWPVLIVIVLLIFADLGNGGLPLMTITALVLVLTRSGREWLIPKASITPST